jgi:hypothetical protein
VKRRIITEDKDMPSKQPAKNTYSKFLDDIAGIYDRAGFGDAQLKR